MGITVSVQNYWLKRRISRRRLVAAGGTGLAAIGLAACGGRTSSGSNSAGQSGAQESQGTPVPGGTLNIYLNYNTPLDPHKTTASFHEVTAGVYSRIFKFKTAADVQVALDHDVENELAVSAESPDGLTWTVKLRPDAKFQNVAPVNGHPVEAEDVKDTFIRAVDPALSNPNVGSLTMIDPAQITTPDKQTVVFKLTYPYAPFNKTLASPSYSLIVPREALTGSYDLQKVAIGSGPYTMESAVPDVAYSYKKNPDYFDKSLAHVDAIKTAIIPDTSQQLAQFTAGKLDQLTIDSPFDLPQAKQNNPKAALFKIASGNTYSVYWQLRDPASAFQDVRVRRAFNMAIDRETLGKLVYGENEWATCFMVPGYMGKWSMQIKDLPAATQQYYKFNLSEAKKMLDAAGATALQLSVVYPNRLATPAFQKQVETIASMLQAAGVKTNLVQVDYNKDWIGNGKGINAGFFPKDTIAFTGYSVFTEPDEWLFGQLDSKASQSHLTVQDPALDAMIDKSRTTVNEADRLKQVHDIISYVADKAYYAPGVGQADTQILTQSHVRNYEYSTTPGIMTETYAKLWLTS
jgi:peptide/nickel transport system substrate-binding protein